MKRLKISFNNFTNIDFQVRVQLSNTRFNRRTGQMNVRATIENISGEDILAPIFFAVKDITNSEITVINSVGIAVDGTPFFLLGETLSPGELFFSPTQSCKAVKVRTF